VAVLACITTYRELAALCCVVPVPPGLVEVRFQDVAHKRCLVLRVLLPLLCCMLAGQQPSCKYKCAQTPGLHQWATL
jgi:hypothetical protein